MSEDINQTTETPDDELTYYKEKAKFLGITHSPNIGLSTLKTKVLDYLKDDKDSTDNKDDVIILSDKAPKPIARSEYSIQREKLFKLVRVKVFNLDPKDSDRQGDFYSFGNRNGDITKFVPYGEYCGPDGYHIPEPIYEILKEQKMTVYKKKMIGPMKNIETHEPVSVRKFSIEVLPTLTPDELNALKQRQIAQGSIDPIEVI